MKVNNNLLRELANYTFGDERNEYILSLGQFKFDINDLVDIMKLYTYDNYRNKGLQILMNDNYNITNDMIISILKLYTHDSYGKDCIYILKNNIDIDNITMKTMKTILNMFTFDSYRNNVRNILMGNDEIEEDYTNNSVNIIQTSNNGNCVQSVCGIKVGSNFTCIQTIN